MTATQKCLALTAVALVAVVPPVAAISAFTLPLFGSNNQQVQQVSLDGATFQEETTNGVTSGSCSYKDDRGRTIEVTFTKDRYGRVVARSRSYGVSDPDAAYYTCLHRVEERKRQQLEAAGVEGFSFTKESDRGQRSYNSGRYPSQNQGQGSYNTGRYPSQNQGQGSYNTGRYPSQNQGQSSYNTGRYPSQSQGVSQAYGRSSSQPRGSVHRNPSRVQTTTQTYGRPNYPPQLSTNHAQATTQSFADDAGVNRPPTSNAQATAPTQTPTSNAQATAPTQTPTSNAQATAPAQTPTSNAQATAPAQTPTSNAQATAPTQTPTSNAQATTPISRRPSAFPSLSGSTSQSSSSKPGQVQMVFQTSHGNSVQFQENTNGGVTTGQCSYVDWRNRTIKINYTKHPDGRIDVVTDPAVWQPMRAYRTCIEQARQEEERLNQEMAETEADLRRQMEDIQSQMERQEQQAFGRGG